IALFAFWHYIYGFAAPLLPLALWLTDRAALRRPGRWRAVIGLVGLAAFMLATSQIQIVLLVAAVQLAYLLVVPRPEVHRVQRLLEWFFAWAVAVLLLAPVLLAQLVAIPDSQRQIWDLGGPGIVNSVIQTAQRYLKVIFGIPVAPNLGGTADFYGSYFVGAAALPFLAPRWPSPSRWPSPGSTSFRSSPVGDYRGCLRQPRTADGCWPLPACCSDWPWSPH